MDKDDERIMQLFPDLWPELEEMRLAHQTAESCLRLALPRGAQVTFRFGNMKLDARATVLGVNLLNSIHPYVHLMNEDTGSRRWVPLDSITGTCW